MALKIKQETQKNRQLQFLWSPFFVCWNYLVYSNTNTQILVLSPHWQKQTRPVIRVHWRKKKFLDNVALFFAGICCCLFVWNLFFSAVFHVCAICFQSILYHHPFLLLNTQHICKIWNIYLWTIQDFIQILLLSSCCLYHVPFMWL